MAGKIPVAVIIPPEELNGKDEEQGTLPQYDPESSAGHQSGCSAGV
jgi:hypothetical protein